MHAEAAPTAQRVLIAKIEEITSFFIIVSNIIV